MTTTYDEVAYPSRVFPQTNPDRLAAHAMLFGLPCAPPGRCRVLDIGGGDGANAIAMAVAEPGSHFVSFDLSPVAVARGQAVISALGLRNIDLFVGDILDVDLGQAPFDYMIAHGVYSWIPDPARAAMMALIARRMAPDGVAFISYNALPGGRIRQIIRDMLHFAVRDVQGVAARADAAHQRLKQIAETFPETTNFQAAVKIEALQFLQRPIEVLAHDELSDTYHSVHLYQFAADCAARGLLFLTEAERTRCGEGFLPPYALDNPDFDVVGHAQDMDFTDLRPFRQSLVVHAGVEFSRRPKPERLLNMHISTPARRNADGVFETGMANVEIPDTVLAAAVEQINAAWPGTVPVSSVIQDAERASALLRMYWTGAVQLHASASTFSTKVSDRPAASPLARFQAARGQTHLSTLNLGTMEVTDPFSLDFIAGLDGRRTRAELVADVAATLKASPGAVALQVEVNLAALAAMPLLVR